MLLDNLYIILIDLSTAALPHLNRLLADRSLNLLLSVIFHTWLLHARQIADDPITNSFDTACTVEMSKLKVSYYGKRYGSPLSLRTVGSQRPTHLNRCRGCSPQQNSGVKESPCLRAITKDVSARPISQPGHHLLAVPASSLYQCPAHKQNRPEVMPQSTRQSRRRGGDE